MEVKTLSPKAGSRDFILHQDENVFSNGNQLKKAGSSRFLFPYNKNTHDRRFTGTQTPYRWAQKCFYVF